MKVSVHPKLSATFIPRNGDMVLGPMGLRYLGQVFPCSIGRGGRTHEKREGDGATPIGIHRIVGMMYRRDRVPAPSDWADPIGPRDLWCDAPEHRDYNHLVKSPFNASHERLHRADPLYDLILVTDWNWPIAVSGKGSAIFMHRWRRPGAPTKGCIALRPDHLRFIARTIVPGVRLIVPA